MKHCGADFVTSFQVARFRKVDFLALLLCKRIFGPSSCSTGASDWSRQLGGTSDFIGSGNLRSRSLDIEELSVESRVKLMQPENLSISHLDATLVFIGRRPVPLCSSQRRTRRRRKRRLGGLALALFSIATGRGPSTAALGSTGTALGLCGLG